MTENKVITGRYINFIQEKKLSESKIKNTRKNKTIQRFKQVEGKWIYSALSLQVENNYIIYLVLPCAENEDSYT